MIITIERECGSAAHEVAEELAKIYKLPLFDKEGMIKKAKELGIYEEVESFFEERPMKSLYPVSATGETPEFGKPIYEKLRKLTSENDFIMIGRCGNYIFRNYEDVVSIFLHAEAKDRISRTMMKQGLDRWSAGRLIDEVDDKRRRFYKFYTGRIWDQASDYDICINTSHTGIDGAVRMIQSYIDTKLGNRSEDNGLHAMEEMQSFPGDPVSMDLFRFE
ncbi:MAG: cytidylate kinase-like family protein [Lachnospiraceae bacterium]|nr:cytidylate kinase-like family protein [Lachnospiraceae bacterium]